MAEKISDFRENHRFTFTDRFEKLMETKWDHEIYRKSLLVEIQIPKYFKLVHYRFGALVHNLF